MARNTFRSELDRSLPNPNPVHPVASDLDAPPSVRAASDELAAAIAAHEQAGAEVDGAEEDLNAAVDADRRAAEEAGRSSEPLPPATAPQEAHAKGEAARVYEAARRRHHAAALELIAAVFATREEWAPQLADQCDAESAGIDELLSELLVRIPRLARLQALHQEVVNAPSPRKGTVRHGMQALDLGGGGRRRGSAKHGRHADLIAELRASLGGRHHHGGRPLLPADRRRELDELDPHGEAA